MAKESQEQPVEKQSPKVKKAAKPISGDLLVYVFLAAVLGFLGYTSWQAVIPPPPTPVTSHVSPAPGVPELQLNQENKRAAPPIEIDEDDIGKTNPFE
jgi:hypothetical protein